MLTAADIEFMRGSHEALMYDTVQIYRDGSEEWDEELKRMVQSHNSLLYDGKARVALDKMDGIIVGESVSTTNRTQGYVTIPVGSVESLQEGDRVVLLRRNGFPTMYVTSVGEDAFKQACIRFAVVTDRNQLNIGGE